MAEALQQAPRTRKKLLCGATSCGGCVKECGVVVYRYLAGLEEDDSDDRTRPAAKENASFNILES